MPPRNDDRVEPDDDSDRDDLRRRVHELERGMNRVQSRVDQLSSDVRKAERAADESLAALERAMRADASESERVKGRFDKQDDELRSLREETKKQTTMIGDLAAAERRRAQESLKMRAVEEADEKRKRDEKTKKDERDKRWDRALKLLPLFVLLAPLLATFAGWLLLRAMHVAPQTQTTTAATH